MIRLFRTSNPINIVLLLFLTVVLRVAFASNLTIAASQPISLLLQKLLVAPEYYSNISAMGNIIVAGFLVFIQALIFNLIVNKHNLLSKQTYLPALLFVYVCSCLPPFLTLSVPLICNFFLLYIFNKLLLIYKQPDAITMLFDIGLIIGLATIFYFPLACLLIFVWLSLVVLRPFYWREWLSGLVAFFTILFFLLVYYFYYQQVHLFLNMWQPFKFNYTLLKNLENKQFLVIIPVIFAAILALFKLKGNFFRSVVLVRKAFIVLLFLAIILTISFYFNPNYPVNHFILLAMPYSVLLAYYFLNATKVWVYETLFILLLAITICAQLGIYQNFNI